MIFKQTTIFYYGYNQATGIGGVGGVFLVYPPLAENFSKIPPPLEILGKFFEKPGKTEKIR